jgi:hypothetical protein
MERTTWQVKELFPNKGEDLMDLREWEPFAISPEGGIFLRRQFLLEGEKSSVGHELSFNQRYGDPED